MKVNKTQIAYNRTRRAQRPQYIVMHDTGNQGKGANADSHFRYFNGGNRITAGLRLSLSTKNCRDPIKKQSYFFVRIQQIN